MLKRLLLALLALLLIIAPALSEAALTNEVEADAYVATAGDLTVEYGLDYTDPYEVALYLHAFIELPFNYITKDEAMDLGWSSSRGNLWDVSDKCSIGGDRFGNREGKLPKEKGRQYYECDVNYTGGYRQGERLVFSNDGLIYYTDDHYNTFTQLYDGWYYEGVEYPLTEEEYEQLFN